MQDQVNYTNDDVEKQGLSFHSNLQDRVVLKMLTNLRAVLAMGGPMMVAGKASMCSVLFKSAIKSILKEKKQTRIPPDLVDLLEQGLVESEARKNREDAAWELRKVMDNVYDAYVDTYCGVTGVRFRPVHKQISNVISLALASKGPKAVEYQMELFLKTAKGIFANEKLSDVSLAMIKDAILLAESDSETSSKVFSLRKALDYVYDEVRLPEVYYDPSSDQGCSQIKESKECMLLDFSGNDSAKIKLHPKLLNDIVMGGMSTSEFDLKNDEAIFHGNISTEREGGFASVRFHTENIAKLRNVLKGCTGFIVTAKNLHEKSRRFKLQLASETKLRGFNYQSEVILSPNEDYSSTFLHIATFWPTMFGHVISNRGKVDTDKVDTIGFIVSKLGDNGKPTPDFVEGDFSIAVKSIKVVY